jgi:PAS domain S-box-containing protein
MPGDRGGLERAADRAMGCLAADGPRRPRALRAVLAGLSRGALGLTGGAWRAGRRHHGRTLRLAQVSTWEWDVRSGQLRWSHAPGPAGGAGTAGTVASFLDEVHPDDRDAIQGTLERAARDGTSFEAEFRTVLADGRVRWHSFRGEVLCDRARRPTTVIAAVRDVTEHREASERLLLAERRYRTLVEQLPLASYVEHLDEESATYISPQIADLVGYTAEEWIADSNFFATVLHPDDRERVLAGFTSMHDSGAAFECEYRLVARDGRIVWIHDAAVVVRDEQGRPSTRRAT